MRRLLALAMSILLAACGSDVNELSYETPGDTAEVFSTLARFNGGVAPRLLGLPVIERDLRSDREVLYSLRSTEGIGSAHVFMLVEPAGDNESRVKVAVQMPGVDGAVTEEVRQTREFRATRLLNSAIEEWIGMRRRGEPTQPGVERINEALGLVLLSLSPELADRRLAASREQADIDDFLGRYVEWNGTEEQRAKEHGDTLAQTEPERPVDEVGGWGSGSGSEDWADAESGNKAEGAAGDWGT